MAKCGRGALSIESQNILPHNAAREGQNPRDRRGGFHFCARGRKQTIAPVDGGTGRCQFSISTLSSNEPRAKPKGSPIRFAPSGVGTWAALARSRWLPAGKKWRSRRACYWLTLTSFTTPGSLPEVPPPLGRRLFLSDEHRHHLLQVLPFGAAGVALNFD